MKLILLAGVFAILVLAVLGTVIRVLYRSSGSSANRAVLPRTPLTPREQAMYFRLQDAFPEHFVLAQVAFSAILRTRDRATRNTFSQKVADFVLCSRGFQVLCVMELDDASHKGKETADAERDALLGRAGIKVLRFKHIPEQFELADAIAKL